MKIFQATRHWLVALTGSMLLVGAAVGLADRKPADQQAIRQARDLSTAFRSVAKQATPAVVSIETTSKPKVMEEAQLQSPFGDDSRLEQFFQRDPQLRRFFEQQRQFRQPRSTPEKKGMGSGFVIDADGIILTNNHVVQDADEVKVRFSDGREYIATDVRTDPRTDVAVVRIDVPKGSLEVLPMGDSNDVQVADWVLAVGSPFGLATTVTQGIISAKGRVPGINERENYLQTDAAINPGNSGGPLVNLDGEVIGINTAISSKSGGYDGIGFAIPINMAKWVATQLIDKGEVDRAYLGVTIQEVSSPIAKQLGVELGKGALIGQVFKDSPAADAGVEPGDLILKLNGKDVSGPSGLQDAVERLELGKKYPLVVLRDGERKTLTVAAREMPEDYSRESLSQRSTEDGSQDYEEIGLSVQDLTPAVARQLGLDRTEGVVVSSVNDDSPAGEVGIDVGDVIMKVGNQRIRNADDFKAAMEDANLEDGILMLVRSGSASRFIVLQ